MSRKTKDVLLRSDRVLVGALGVVLCAASAALGAAAADHPRTDEVVLRSTVALESSAVDSGIMPKTDDGLQRRCTDSQPAVALPPSATNTNPAIVPVSVPASAWQRRPQ